MTGTPSKADIHVATDTLWTEAVTWQAHRDRMADLAQQAQALDAGRLEVGVFQLVLHDYQEVVRVVTERCTEGTQRMAEISQTLRQVADTYDAEEAKNDHMIRNLY